MVFSAKTIGKKANSLPKYLVRPWSGPPVMTSEKRPFPFFTPNLRIQVGHELGHPKYKSNAQTARPRCLRL